MRINRFVDRDMVMRYHWGYGVGHTYAHHNYRPTRPQPRSDHPLQDSEDMQVDLRMF